MPVPCSRNAKVSIVKRLTPQGVNASRPQFLNRRRFYTVEEGMVFTGVTA